MWSVMFCCLLAVVNTYSLQVETKWYPRSGMLKKADEVAGSGFRRTSSSSSYSTGCVTDCATKANQMLSADTETAKHMELGNKAYRYADQFKPSVVNVMCTAYNSTMDCMRPCTNAGGKQQIKDALDTIGYRCVDTKFHVHAPCYYRVNNEMLTACNIKCATKKATLESDMTREMQSVADVDAFIRHFCEYMDCDSDCDSDKIKEECGADAARIMQGFYKKSIDALRGPLAQKGFAIPSVCNNIGKSDDDE